MIKLKDVRLSFPNLFEPATFNGEKGKYEATFLLPKDREDVYEEIVAAIEKKLEDAKIKIPRSKWFIKDGDEVEYDGYEGNWTIKASNRARPTILSRDKELLTEDDGTFYAGCHVNAIIDIWIQNNQFGKRVNANLYGVQFFGDDDAFGTKHVASVDEFADFD